MKIIFTGGGTAGHVNPAVSMIEEIRRNRPTAEFLFIGRLGGDENRIIREKNIRCEEIEVRGIARRLSVQNVKNVFMAFNARARARKIIKKFSPDVVVGTGGYVSWPVISAAKSLGIPTVIHESNVYPGLTTRLLAKRVDTVLLGNQKTRDYLGPKENMQVVGNPLRGDFLSQSREQARKRLGISKNEIFIVSFGGSIGAEKVNSAVLGVMRSLSAKTKNIRHIHAVGRRYYESIKRSEMPGADSGCTVVAYIDDMPTHLRAADIVICRCGAMTLSEIALVGVAAILIPSPNVTDNHQYKNGKFLSDMRSAILIEESELSEKRLREKVALLCENKAERQRLSKSIEKFAKPEAKADCCHAVLSLIDDSREKSL